MKKLTSILFILLISFCFVLTGCDGSTLSMPENFSTPVSNGGFVVGAGNYMYFANAYKSYSSITSADDNGNNVAQHSFKRLKLQENLDSKGNPIWLKLAKDENNSLTYETVANKILGYETTNLYVVNEYLYFTTPNVHKNNENNHEFDKSTLFRLKLDGSDLKEILTTKTSTANFYLTKDKTLLIFDDAKIQKINLAQNQTSVNTLASNVANVVFPNNEEQDIAWLYYTSNREDGDLFSGNILNKVSVKTGGESIEVYRVAGETINIVAQENGIIFYTITGGSNAGLYSNDFSTSSSRIRHRTLITGIENSSDLLFIESQDAFVFLYEDKLYIQLLSETNNTQADQLTSEATTIYFYNGSYVYYSTSAGIYRYSILQNTHQQISNHSDIQSGALDFDGRYVYYFVKGEGQEGETKYLYRADTYSSDITTECIAERLESDIPEEDESISK